LIPKVVTVQLRQCYEQIILHYFKLFNLYPGLHQEHFGTSNEDAGKDSH